MSKLASFPMLLTWRLVPFLLTAVAGCGGCGQSHALPDAAAMPTDASVACEWQLGEGRRLSHAASLSTQYAGSPVAFAREDSSAWVITLDEEGSWLQHLDVNGHSIIPAMLVHSGAGSAGTIYNAIVLGSNGGGLVIYDACPPEGEPCLFGGGLEYETRRVPQLRAFGADGRLGPVQYLDAPGSINEPLFGSVAGDGFLVVVANVVPANSQVQPVSATGELLGPPMRGLFSTGVFAGLRLGPSSATFVLEPHEDGTVWLATLDASGRPRGEVRSEIRFELPEVLSGAAISANGERIVLTTLDELYGMTPAGLLEWSRPTPHSLQAPIAVGETIFLLSSQDFVGPRHLELSRLGDMGSVEELIDLGHLAFNPDDMQGLTGAVSTGEGLLLFERVRRPYGELDRDPHINVYPVRCLPPHPYGDAG